MNLADDDFALFGLPPAQRLDRDRLDERRRQLQASVHPDRFAGQGASAQRLAMQWAVRVNEAWQRLRNPLTRAAYLCELRGVPIAAESNTAMPAAFLMQQMAWREALDEAGDTAAVQALDDGVAREETALHEQLARLLDDDQDTAAAAGQVRALMFVVRFREELARRLERLEAH